MKQTLFVAVAVSSAFVLTLALAGRNAEAVPAVQQDDPLKFYPLKVGHRWTYRMTDSKTPDDNKRFVTLEVEREEPYVRPKMTKDGKEVAEMKFGGFILKSTSGGKVTRDHVVVMDDGIYKAQVADTPINPPMPFVKWPDAFNGKTWDINSTMGSATAKGTCTPEFAEQKFSNGETRKVLKVKYRDKQPGDDRTEIDFSFLPGIGMYQQRVKTKNHEITLVLVSSK